jgi:hypothetical protein
MCCPISSSVILRLSSHSVSTCRLCIDSAADFSSRSVYTEGNEDVPRSMLCCPDCVQPDIREKQCWHRGQPESGAWDYSNWSYFPFLLPWIGHKGQVLKQKAHDKLETGLLKSPPDFTVLSLARSFVLYSDFYFWRGALTQCAQGTYTATMTVSVAPSFQIGWHVVLF